MGGPTLTKKPLPGSPLIDAGSTLPLSLYDQRGPGYPRLIGTAMDVGAVEISPNISMPPHDVSQESDDVGPQHVPSEKLRSNTRSIQTEFRAQQKSRR